MWGSALLYLLSKFKGLLAVAKLGKVGGTVISMFVTMGAYALLFPWQFAVGLVIMILIHEMGHVWAARWKGLPVSAPTFIPFLGALITLKRHPRDAETEAFVAFGGPVVGTIGALAALWVGIQLDSMLLYSVAMIGIFINLLNLLPIHPLDGGRIVTAVSRWFWLLGLVGGLVVIIYLRSILFFVIWVMFAFDLYGKYGPRRKRKHLKDLPFHAEIPIARFEEAGMYVPGEEHRRKLPFTTYSDIADGKQTIVVDWPGVMEPVQKITLPVSSIVHEVQMVGAHRRPAPPEAVVELLVEMRAIVEPYENDRYYEVPVKTRWLYGAGYIGLAAFLAYVYLVVLPPYLPKI